VNHPPQKTKENKRGNTPESDFSAVLPINYPPVGGGGIEPPSAVWIEVTLSNDTRLFNYLQEHIRGNNRK